MGAYKTPSRRENKLSEPAKGEKKARAGPAAVVLLQHRTSWPQPYWEVLRRQGCVSAPWALWEALAHLWGWCTHTARGTCVSSGSLAAAPFARSWSISGDKQVKVALRTAY